MTTLRILAILEGISLLLLFFVAMPLKYIYDQPMAVEVVGMIHGLLFIAYSIWLFMIAYQDKWKTTPVVVSFVSAFVPFGTFYSDKKYFRGN